MSRRPSPPFPVDDEKLSQPSEEEAAKVEPLRRIRVAEPFQVVYDATVYLPHAVVEVPESLAAQWLRDQWVTEA